MFTAFLFIVFLTAYAYIFTPATKTAPVPSAPVEAEIPSDVTPTELPDITLDEVQIPVTPTVAMAITPIECVISVTPDYSAMSSAQLRKECSAAGIKWRNAHGNKHLTKAEMIAALQ